MAIRLSIVVMGHPVSSSASRSALKFCRSALAKGCTVEQVFFLHDASWQAATARDVAQAWADLAQRGGFKLDLCITAIEKRGIVVDQMQAGFQLRGLGQLVDAALQVDRTVTFR